MDEPDQILEHVFSPFNEIAVERIGRRVDLEVAGATFATWHPERLLTGYSWDAITAGCLLSAAGPPRSVLVLGLGGGTVTRQLRHLLPEARLTGVELDPEVTRLARQYMELDRQGVEVIEGDGYAFLAGTRRTFDAIVDDIYLTGSDDVWRPEDLTGSVLAALAARLNPGGVALANFITDGHHDLLRQAAQRAFAKRFAATALLQPPRGFNGIIAGGEGLAPPRGLRRWTASFPTEHDRALWPRIKVRASGPASPGRTRACRNE